jgi:FG-GAP-like repeat
MHHIYNTYLTLVAGLLAWLNCSSPSAAATLVWDASPEPTVAGYLVHYGTASGVYTSTIDARNTLTATIPDPPVGVTYFAVVTAYDDSSMQSPPSNEVTFTGVIAQTPVDRSDWSLAGTADFNKDSARDTIWQNLRTGERAILETGSGGGGIWRDLGVIPIEWRIAGVGDFNWDGNADIVWQNTVTGQRVVWFMQGSVWFGNYLDLGTIPTEWSISAVGDFTGDGGDDIVWEDRTTGRRVIWFMEGGTTWAGNYADLGVIPLEWKIAGAGDFNTDGHTDLIWENTESGRRVIWFMQGSVWPGSYADLGIVSRDWRIAGVGDFNGDGSQDVLWQNESSAASVIWFMQGAYWPGNYSVLTAGSAK